MRGAFQSVTSLARNSIGVGSVGTILLPVAAAAAVAGLAAPQGSYFPTSWGWALFAFAAVSALALVLADRIEIGPWTLATLAALVVAVAWVAATLVWSANPSQSVSEIQRDLVYVAAALGFAVLVRAGAVPRVLGGVLVGITVICSYALSRRLFPDTIGALESFSSYRLHDPLGYWNALGVFAVMGTFLAAYAAVTARRWVLRAAAGAAIVPIVLALYFTFSRGAWYALIIAAAIAIAVDRRRLRFVTGLLFVVPAPAAAVWIASNAVGLTRLEVALELASRDGRHVAKWLLVLVPLGAVGALVFALLERYVRPPRPVRIAYGVALLAGLSVALVLVFARAGGPVDLASRAYDSFRVRGGTGKSNLNERLFLLSANGRIDLWNVAWENGLEHPWVGSGAGTYEQNWLEHRPFGGVARDGHSLYFEWLSDVGRVGLSLIVVAFALPLAAFVRARRHPAAVPALAAYLAFVVHAGVDWDWEMPAVVVTALLCGLSLAVLADGERLRVIPRTGQWAAAGGAIALTLVGLVVAFGNAAIAASEAADDRGDYLEAKRQAQRAVRWAPWSASSWQSLGHAQLSLDQRRRARESFLEALERAPSDWSIWYDLGTASDDPEKRRAYRRAEQLNPLSQNIEVLRILKLLPERPRGAGAARS